MLGKKMTFLWAGLALTFFVAHFTTARGQEESADQDGSYESTAGERILDFRTIVRTTGSPLGGVTLEIQVDGKDRRERRLWKDETNAQGRCKIQLPDFHIRTLRIYPQKEGFVPLRVFWRGDPTPPEIPETFTVAVEPGITIGGTVRNEQGHPIQDVTVSIYYTKDDPKAAENARVNISLHRIKTDNAGRWKFDGMPAEIDKNELRIFLMHPRYLSDSLRPGFIPMPITPQPSITKLRDLSAVMVMKEGNEVTGKITDKGGNPIAGAKIYDTEDYWFRSTKPFAETDAQGQFRASANPGTAIWTIQAPGYAPDLRVSTIRAGMPPVNIRLGPGGVIEGKVADRAGEPIEGAGLWARTWRRERMLHLEAKTDAEGNFRIADAPSDEVTFNIGKEGYMLLEKYVMKPGERKYDITLRPTLKVRGTVLDAQTGQPIDKFTVNTVKSGIDVEDGRAPSWHEHDVRTFTGGQYELEYMQEIFTYRIRVDAEGYQTAVSDYIRPSETQESSIVRDFKLDKGAPLEGIVFSPDGTPLSGANVVIATNRLRIVNGKIDSRSSEQNLVIHTNTHGRFRFKPRFSSYWIVVLGEQGYAKITSHDFTASQTITVSPWGRIEGTLRIGAQPGVDKLITFWPESSREQEQQPRIRFEYEVKTDEDGHFAFPHVLPGEGTVARATPLDDSARGYSHHIGVEVKPGRTTRIQIGGTGRPVVGKITIPDMIENIFDWQFTDRRLRASSPISPPYRVFSLECDKDGSFRVEDVPAGDYCIYVDAYGPPPNSRNRWGERIGMLSWAFKIPVMPGGRSNEPLDLGVLELQVVGRAALAPSLIGKPLPDLNSVKIDLAPAQAKGKMILVCFWDMNQRPSRHCITQLAKQSRQLQDKGVIVIAVHASNTDEKTFDEWVEKNNIPFPVGMVQADEEKIRFNWGVCSLPWLILTDKQHTVRAAGFNINELDGKIKALREK